MDGAAWEKPAARIWVFLANHGAAFGLAFMFQGRRTTHVLEPMLRNTHASSGEFISWSLRKGGSDGQGGNQRYVFAGWLEQLLVTGAFILTREYQNGIFPLIHHKGDSDHDKMMGPDIYIYIYIYIHRIILPHKLAFGFE